MSTLKNVGSSSLIKAMMLAVFLVTVCAFAGQAAQVTMQRLYKGNLWLNAEQHTQIATRLADIYAEPGSRLFIMTNDDAVAIYVLDEPSPTAMKLVVNKQVTHLRVGQEFVLTEKKDVGFEVANPGKLIPVRRVSRHDVGGLRAFVCEFSIPAVVRAVKPINKLVSSTDPKDKEAIHRILKNAMLLHETGNPHEKFGTGKSKSQ